ncbi:MAG: NTP transferase domain-containing protein [Candidatus Cloacimonetes bacterium]|nr:NTP transferase domain-containing protein [Candidatus Cloacimonadota bacterium]
MIALIMAGGAGTRFWPKSRQAYPKQFLSVSKERSMIQLTVDRLSPLMDIKDIYIVTAASQVSLIQSHLPNLPKENIIIEPFGMNTAPCIALSVWYLKDRYPKDTPMIVLPADHDIKDEKAFVDAMRFASEKAKLDGLITFGIVPDYPATGYGYIEAGEELEEGLTSVLRFKEKPDLDTAQAFLEQGGFYWNSGMFCWQLSTIMDAFETHQPELYQSVEKIAAKWQQDGFDADISELYKEMPRTPIDKGIMEKAERRFCIPVDLGWSDVGSWKALSQLASKDKDQNHSKNQIIALDAKSNYIDSDKLVAIIGLEDICLIDTEDALLICPKERSEDVRHIVDIIKEKGLSELL